MKADIAAGGGKGGFGAASKALAQTLIAEGIAKGISGSYFEGTEDTGSGGNVDGRGGMYAILHPHEGVVNRKGNEANPGLVGAMNAGTVDEWITKKFGTIDDILMSTFVSQIETNNFFHLKQEEQKTILDKALHLESISAFSSLLKESILAHNDKIGRAHV